MSKAFVYPDHIRRGEIFAEDIEEAIMQYLVKQGGFDYDDLASSGEMEFIDCSTGRGITTKVLKIKFK